MVRDFIRRLAATILASTVIGALPPETLAQQSRLPERNVPKRPETATEPQGFLVEPDLVQRAAIFGDRHFANAELTEGFNYERWNPVPGSGGFSLGPAYRRWYSNDRAVAEASGSISWRGYKTAQGRVEFRRLARSRLLVGAQVRWQDLPQMAFYGEGPASGMGDRSEYALKSTNLVGYATVRPIEWLGIGANIGWLKPSIGSPGGFLQGTEPDARDLFPGDVVFALPDQPAFLHSEASITADTRDFAGRPTTGGLYRAATAFFSDRDTGTLSFRRYDVEAARFVPLADSRVVVAIHGWLVGTSTGDGRFVPFYMQPSLGGHNSLRSYPDYRFHDRSLLVLNVETRVAMMTHVDAAAFVDAGNVAPRAGDLNLAKRSYGVGLRLHSRRQTFARVDVARGGEGWRVVLHLTDPLNLARLSRRTAPVPFVP